MSLACSQIPQDSPLAVFLTRHDDAAQSGFITRLDRSSVTRKRLAFYKALVLNAVVFIFLVALSSLTILKSFFSALPSSTIVSLGVTQHALLALAISVVLQTTVIPFVFGECRFRLRNGFRQTEIVIRRQPKSALKFNVLRKDHAYHYWRFAVRAVNPALLYSNFKAILSADYWTMEYSAVSDAMDRIASGDLSEQDFEFSVCKRECSIWTCCELWRMHEIAADQLEIAAFEALVTQGGKAKLLSQWHDAVSSAKQAPVHDQLHSYQSLSNHFSQAGLDYEALWGELIDQTPGALHTL